MIVVCQACATQFDDEFRTTICPHGTFYANDGKNNFAHNRGAFLKLEKHVPKLKLSVKLIFAWYDLWVGVYVDRKNKALYIFPIPMVGVVIKWGR